MKFLRVLFPAVVLSVLTQCLHGGEFALSVLEFNRPDGIYAKGEEIVVSGILLKAGEPAPDYRLRVTIRWESIKTDAIQDFPCDGKPFRVSFQSDTPGWVYFTFQVIGSDGEMVQEPTAHNPQNKKSLVAEIGAIVAPQELCAADTEPADFDEFWRRERAKLDAVPMNPRLEKLDSGREDIELYTIKVDAGVSQPVTAYLAVPANVASRSLPACLTFLSWMDCDADRNEALNLAAHGAVAMTATWHGFDVNREPQYYLDHCKTIRIQDTMGTRETFYLREVLVRALRAADYLKSRPEWNGRDFLVSGGSLAGAQAAAVAALDKQVTLAFIHTSCLCGFSADLAGRKSSLPFSWMPKEWLTTTTRMAAAYCDVIHLASRIRCESYFCTGFADEVCPPSGVYCAYNNVPSGVKKQMTTNPRTGHYGTTRDANAERRLEEFFQVALMGQSVPRN